VLALIGLVFGQAPFTGFIALALGLLAVLFGLLAVLFGLLGWSRTRDRAATNRMMTMIGTVLGIGAAAFGIGGIVMVFSAVDKLGKDLQYVNHNSGAIGDVVEWDCSVTSKDGVPSARATVKITNKTDRPQSYMATIGVDNASGVRIGEINTVSNSLDPGTSVTMSGMDTSGNPISGAGPGEFTCVVANVNRFPNG
jgi:hypothetical protein